MLGHPFGAWLVHSARNAGRQVSGGLAERVFLALLAFFTAFTLQAQLLSLLDAPFAFLYAALILAIGAALLGAFLAPALTLRLRGGAFALPPITREAFALGQPNRAICAAGGLALALALLAAIALQKADAFTPFWAAILASSLLGASQAGRLTEPPATLHPPAATPVEPPSGLGFLAVLLAALLLYSVTLVPNVDDALFLSLAAGAKDAPGGIMEFDTMLGVPGIGVIKSTYQIESYLLLSSVLSKLFGLETIFVAHAVVPALSIAFGVSVLAIIFSTLFGRHWMVCMGFYLAIFVLLNGEMRSFGNFGLFRMFQGKAVLVMVMIPAIIAATICTIRQGGAFWLAITGALMVTAVGFSANALYIGPLAAGLVALVALINGGTAERIRALSLAAAVLYPLALALYLLAFDPPGPSEYADASAPAAVMWRLLGEPYLHAAFLVVLIAAALSGLVLRPLRAVSLYVGLFFLVVFNPFLWELYGASVTGNVNERLLWAVPVPLIAATALGLAWVSLRAPLARAALGLAVLATTALPGSLLLQQERFAWRVSPIKVMQPAYDTAREVNGVLRDDQVALLPEPLAIWVVTLDDARPVVEARAIYTPQRRHLLPDNHLQTRRALFDWVSCRGEGAISERALSEIGVGLVVIPTGACGPDLAATLDTIATLRPVGELGNFRLYHRAPDAGAALDAAHGSLESAAGAPIFSTHRIPGHADDRNSAGQ
ncbi:DUF6077 domain-containing protein [Limimaricola hongkongensis]|uniref:Uncharacterized protein n=1 Tax=Limimaricola hongkongensis DSM 17492 TaxID=1122180 RepID=A0A017H9M9_9RHOB|nr:DUF6077 domain-containing protein [Limimaricola hongkongensis]EYD70868.1 hypothetical protein Lokhon_02512 [Limimaricola hongkongensis DSM 17492]